MLSYLCAQAGEVMELWVAEGGQESNHVLVKHRCELCLALKGEFRFSSLFPLLLGT